MDTTFEMVAKTFQGLEGVLAEELRALGATSVSEGKRMVAFEGDLAMLYKANMCCRTALRILKPFYKFTATDPDELYSKVKDFDWASMMSADQTFAIDTVAYSDEFRNSQFVTYRVKDAIVDRFRDTLGDGHRPSVRLDGADIMINVHISGREVTLSLDSSGESLHKRGWRKAQTEAPINEVLAAGIILLTGWKGDRPFVDPMCGSGTFAIEAALIAANIYPGIYRKHFAFENWPDFDPDLLAEIYNDDTAERPVTVPILASDISPRAIQIARDNALQAGVAHYISFEVKPIAKWEEPIPEPGVLVTNPPYGKRIGAEDMNALYSTLGRVFKHIFKGYDAWVIGYHDEYFQEIGLAPSQKIAINNGGLDCELREYVIFEGSKRDFRAAGGKIKEERPSEKDARGGRDKDARGTRGGRREGRHEGDRPRRDAGRRPADKRRESTPNRDERAEGSRPYVLTDRDASPRPYRPADRKPADRKPAEIKRKPIERKPSIPVENEVVLRRPTWRVRRKDENNDKKL